MNQQALTRGEIVTVGRLGLLFWRSPEVALNLVNLVSVQLKDSNTRYWRMRQVCVLAAEVCSLSLAEARATDPEKFDQEILKRWRSPERQTARFKEYMHALQPTKIERERLLTKLSPTDLGQAGIQLWDFLLSTTLATQSSCSTRLEQHPPAQFANAVESTSMFIGTISIDDRFQANFSLLHRTNPTMKLKGAMDYVRPIARGEFKEAKQKKPVGAPSKYKITAEERDSVDHRFAEDYAARKAEKDKQGKSEYRTYMSNGWWLKIAKELRPLLGKEQLQAFARALRTSRSRLKTTSKGTNS
ncbi:MAG: hypothetical protein ACREBG_29965 [Pyrinomonadaceae bacterium]